MKARCIQESDIATAPPVARELWDWLLKECNHKDVVVAGRMIKRGQCIRTYKNIQDGLKWLQGWKARYYSKWDIERAMKKLRTLSMIATEKTTRGIVITVLKYDYYQDPKNYESHTPATPKATDQPQTRHTINKNDKNEKNESIINNSVPAGRSRRDPDLQALVDYATRKGFGLQGSQQSNRRYAYNLLRKKGANGERLGLKTCCELVDGALACRGQAYAPQINDFKALFYKFQDLVGYVRKHQQGGRIG